MTPDIDDRYGDSRITRTAKRLLAHQAAARVSLPPSPTATVAMLLLLLVFLGGIVAPVGLMIWQATHPTTVIAEGAAGTFESASSSAGGIFGPTLTTVQTSTGTVTVRGTFSALRGEPLIVTADNKHKQLQLCTVEAQAVCATLEGDWAGTLMPTAQTRHTVNFVRHGLSTGNLDDWLALGMLGTFTAFAIAIATTCREDQDDGADDPQ